MRKGIITFVATLLVSWLFLAVMGFEAQAQSCTGSVECGAWEGGIYLCPDNSTCVPAESCPSGGACTWVDPFCNDSGSSLDCSFASESSCTNYHNNCPICAQNSCTWNPGSGGGPTPTTPPGVTPEPTLPACVQSNCGTQCPPDGSGTCQGTTTCMYLGGQNGHRCWDDGTCCQAGGSQTQCFDICNENTVSPPTRTCQDTSFTCEVDPICPGGECCLKASCIPSTYTCSNIVWRDGSGVGKWPSVQSRPG